MLHGNDTSARATCLTAILLTNSEDARRLVETQIGGEVALCFGLKRCTRTRFGRRHALFMPAVLEQPWRDLAARYAQEAGMEVIPTVANLAAGLLEHMRVFGDTWAAIVPATSILLDGQSIDACLALLGQLPADYSYGADFPRGAAPLVVSQPIIAMGAARYTHGDLLRSVLQTIVECLPHFHGVPLPAPPSVQAPDLELALDSAQQATELERIAHTLIDQEAPLILARFVIEARRRRTIRLRSTFRLAQKRPYRARTPGRHTTTVLCLSFRASKLSGGDSSFHNLITTIDRARFRPLLASPSAVGSIVDTARRLEIPTLAVPLLQHTAGPLSTLLPVTLRLARFATRYRAELVYANSSSVGWLAGAAALMLGLPLVTRVIEELDGDTLEDSLIALADRVAVPSHYIASCCAQRGIPLERIRVIHEGVDESWFAPAPQGVDLRARYGCPARAPLIGVVSRLDDVKKALDQAIRAAALIVAERPDARMMICGQAGLGAAQQVAQLDELIAQLGLQAHVHLVGAFADMREIYPQFDLLLHPAPREPFGLVLTEAMAMGVPVVAVDGGGAPEQVRHGHTGLLVARADPRLLAQAICQLLDQPELRRQFAQQARTHVRRHFVAEQFAHGMETVFAEAIQLWHDRVARES